MDPPPWVASLPLHHRSVLSLRLRPVALLYLCSPEKVRSPIANDARALPAASPRVPASTRASHRTATRRAHARAPPTTSPLEHNQPHTRDAHAQPSKQPTHIANTQSTFAQHTLPWHCMTPLLRTSPSPGPRPPSPDRGSAPPRPSGRPALPVTVCATCPADSTCAHAASACAAQPQATRTASRAQRDGGRTLARTASGCRLSRAATPGLTAHTLTGLAAEHSRAVLLL